MPDSQLTLDQAVDLTRTGDLWLFRGRSAADHAIRVRHQRARQPRRDGRRPRRPAAADVARRARQGRCGTCGPAATTAAYSCTTCGRPSTSGPAATSSRPGCGSSTRRSPRDGGGGAEDHRPPGRHAVPGDRRAGRSLGAGSGTPQGTGRDDVLRRGGRRDVHRPWGCWTAGCPPTTTTPACSGPATTCELERGARLGEPRSASWSDPEGQPQLSQTPVAGMAMLQVGQTCPSNRGRVAWRARSRARRAATLGANAGLPPSSGTSAPKVR